MRSLFCVAVLVALAWLRPDLSVARSDVFRQAVAGQSMPTEIIAVAGQLGLMALCVFWLLTPVARVVVRWAMEERADPAAERLQQRMEAALRQRRDR